MTYWTDGAQSLAGCCPGSVVLAQKPRQILKMPQLEVVS